MALIVEDGTGLENADSYASLATADAYVAAYQPDGADDWDAATDAEQEVALRRATLWLDTNYASRWIGVQIKDSMALDWPRFGAYSDGVLLANDELPVRLVQACVEAAIRFLSGELDGDVPATSGGIRREVKRLGPLSKEVEYVSSKGTSPARPKVDALLASLVRGAGRVSLA